MQSLRRNLVVFSVKLLPDPEEPKDGDEGGYGVSNDQKPGTAEFFIQVESRRSIKVGCSLLGKLKPELMKQRV